MANILQKIKNFGRKILVKLKYHPNILPMLVMFIAFVVFSLNLKNVSAATLYINHGFIGLYQFVSYLLSILSMVALMNAFPRREKVKMPFIVLTAIMIAVIVFTNIMYVSLVDNRFILHSLAPEAGGNPIKDPVKITELASAKMSYIVNIIFEVVALVLLALVPVIKKLMAKVNTRVQIAENENLSTIDISND